MLVSQAQGEANIWYFGQNAGIDFNSGSPVALTNGQLVTDEGCATISNSSGQLLFYHQKEDGSDDYTEMTYELYRHFSDKNVMRKKIVDKQKCMLMPQPLNNSIFNIK